MTTSELLGLRAGLDGPPVSRADAAAQLGISRHRAARLERRGLRALHSACGGGSTRSGGSPGSPSRLVRLATRAPSLQPAVYLTASDAPALREVADLDRPRGKREVKDETASVSPSHAPPGVVQASIGESALRGDDGGTAALPIILAACLALLAALVLVGLRRRAVATRSGAATITTAVATAPATKPSVPAGSTAATGTSSATPDAAPTTASASPTTAATTAGSPTRTTGSASPEVAPPAAALSPESAAQRATAPGAAPQPPSQRIKRSAGVVASGLVSFAVRELIRRRGRR
jgi:hypothetical protein